MILVGATKKKIREAFDKLKKDKGIDVEIIEVDTFEGAVEKAREVAVAGDIVTLSPACASFDMFPNFMERGIRFKELVHALK